ncbi:MAG TPA: DMT family transporter [Thermoleophilaceae bacterium]|nr:DMT family transporter [Thermoleophilaceae bacterium]
MDTDRVVALVVTLLVGGLIALQPPANALMARITSDLGAAFLSLTLSTVIVGVLLVTIGDPSDLRGVSGLRPVHLLGGIGGAAIVLVSLITVRTLGAGGVAAALIAMQLTVAAAADRYGLLGLDRNALGVQGLVAIVLLLAGTWLMATR